MAYIKNSTGDTDNIEFVLVAHLFLTGDKRELGIKQVHERERTAKEYQAHDNNWRLSRRIKLPYHPQPGTRIRLTFSPQDKDRFRMLMEDAQRMGVPRVSPLFVVNDVMFWEEDGADHATCEFEAPNRDYARNLSKQLAEGFGFERMD